VQERTGNTLSLVTAALAINRDMPYHVADRVAEMLVREGINTDGARVLLLGVASKPNVGDIRNSPALPLAERLESLGVVVGYHDPYVPPERTLGTFSRVRNEDLSRAIATADAVVLLQAHGTYDVEGLALSSRRFLDTTGQVRGHVDHL
jgi:UDP-N-acetyl-D-mannosaminuronate dehydrogenase